MALANLLKSLEKREILVPRLRTFLDKEGMLVREGRKSHAKIVIQDALLTAKIFADRMRVYQQKSEFSERYFHPSQLGQCLRRLWFDKFKAPYVERSTDRVLESYLIFEIGTYLHVVIQNLCQRAGFLVKREIPIIDHHQRIIGHADGLLKIDGRKYLLEIKTSNSRRFVAMQTPDHGHVQQAHSYMKALGLSSVLLVYLNKDNAQLKEFLILFDDTFYDEYVEKRVAYFHRRVKKRIPPMKEGHSPNQSPCLYCGYLDLCYSKKRMEKFTQKIQAQ